MSSSSQAGVVLITGAAGFVGSRLSKALLARGERVVGVDNLNNYYAFEHKQRHLRDLQSHPNFQFYQFELNDAEMLKSFLTTHQPRVVAHLAAMAAVRYSVQHPLLYAQANVQASLNVLDAARLCGSDPVCVLSSTGSVYGATTPAPFREDACADRPLAPYPASKRAMELFAHSHHHLFKLRTTIVRFFNVYGPHGRPDMMPWQWTTAISRGEPIKLFNGGRLKRDWTYIDDIVDGFMLAMDKACPYEIFNLGCGNPGENVHFVRVLEGLLGRKAIVEDVPAPTSEPLVTYADVSKARALLGYEPKVRVEEGLRRFVEWMREERLI